MSFLRLHLSDVTIEMICTKVREEFVDKIQDFDYTAFEHFGPEDQTTIQGINVDKRNGVLSLSRQLRFDYIQSPSWQDVHDPFRQQYGSVNYKPIQIRITTTLRVIDNKVACFLIGYDKSDSMQPNETVFSIYTGEEKYLINQTFYDKASFEGYVFQQSTVDKPIHFGLDYVLEIIQKLKV